MMQNRCSLVCSRSEQVFFSPFIFLAELTLITPTPICYTAKNNGFASFNVTHTGKIKYLKLVHVSGGTVCTGNHIFTKWGCPYGNYQVNDIFVVTTNEANQIIFPTVSHTNTLIRMEEAHRDANELIQRPDFPVDVQENQKFRIWYTEDLYNYAESNNYGTHCVRVYARYCQRLNHCIDCSKTILRRNSHCH